MAPTAIECPYCQAELMLPEEGMWYTCEHCRRALHIQAQAIYARGRDHFLANQEAGGSLFDRKAKKYRDTREAEILRSFQQAYSALEEALRYELADSQREFGIEMMAEITRLFLYKHMISPLEGGYWSKLVVELTTQRECDELDAKLAGPSRGGLLGLLQRWRWWLRRRQLARSLARLDREIRRLEDTFGRVEPLYARRFRPELIHG